MMDEKWSLLTIGDFARRTGLSTKALRIYEQKGLLAPANVDPHTGYRYYDEGALDRALVIKALRVVDMPVSEIARFLEGASDRTAFSDALRAVETKLSDRIEDYSRRLRLARMLVSDGPATEISSEVQYRTLPPILVAGIRGRWVVSPVERHRRFLRLLSRLDFAVAGPPIALAHRPDCYEHARLGSASDYEVSFPVDTEVDALGVRTHELPGGEGLSIHHRGAEGFEHGYNRLVQAARARGLQPVMPIREHFLKFGMLPGASVGDDKVTRLDLLVTGHSSTPPQGT